MESEMGCDNICTAAENLQLLTSCWRPKPDMPCWLLTLPPSPPLSLNNVVVFWFFVRHKRSRAVPPGGWIMSTALLDWNSNVKMMKMQNDFQKQLHNNRFGANNSGKWCQISHRSSRTRALFILFYWILFLLFFWNSFYQCMITIAKSQNTLSNWKTFDCNKWGGYWSSISVLYN